MKRRKLPVMFGTYLGVTARGASAIGPVRCGVYQTDPSHAGMDFIVLMAEIFR